MSVTDWLPRDEGSRTFEKMNATFVEPVTFLCGRLQVRQILKQTERKESERRLVWKFYASESREKGENTSAEWVELLNATTERPSGDAFMKVVDGILDLVSDRSFSQLGRIFADLEVRKTSTDFLVALLRLTYAERTNIGEWQDFLVRVRAELGNRSGVDETLELAGLDDTINT